MPEQHVPVSQESIERGYEVQDASVKGLSWFVIFFILTAVVLHVFLWFLLIGYVWPARAVDRPQSGVTRIDPTLQPPLQPIPQHNRPPEEDMRLLRQEENQMFQRLGWQIDPSSGAAVIPPELVRKMAGNQGVRP